MAATTQQIPSLLSTLAKTQSADVLHEMCAEVMSSEKQEALLNVIKEANPSFKPDPKKRAYFQVERDKPVITQLLQAIEEGTFSEAVRSIILRGDLRGIGYALEMAVKDEEIVIDRNTPERQEFADFVDNLKQLKGDPDKDCGIVGMLYLCFKKPHGQALLGGTFTLFDPDWVHNMVYLMIRLYGYTNMLTDKEKDFLLEQCDASARPDLLGELLVIFIRVNSISACDWVLGKKNFNVNCADARGRSLLSQALWAKNMDLANQLLDRGADMWQKDQNGYTPVNISGYVSPTQWRLYKHLLLQRTLYAIAGLIASIGLAVIFISAVDWLTPPQSRTYQWIR